MRPPEGPSGEMTVSTNQLRTYGAGGFRLVEHEGDRGCPRKYKATYVEKRIPAEMVRSYALDYGSMFHDVLFLMEEEGLTPDEALERAFPAHMPPEAWKEARDDLIGYLERGASPTDRFATLEVETELDALLYVDEEFGPVHFRGFIDWIGVDLDDLSTLHVVDYKTNRHPPTEADVRGDVQMKGYHWLVMQHAARWGARRVIVHLDAVKWREIEVAFTEEEIDDWHSWAVAVVRKILRDEDGEPMLNPGCDWCPVKKDCPAFLSLPQHAADLAERVGTLQSNEEKLRWRDAANAVRLLLEKAVKSIDSEFADTARTTDVLVVGDQQWTVDTDWSTVIDLRRLHQVLDEQFYDVVATSEAKLKALTKQWSPSEASAVLGCVERVPSGTKVKRKKVD